MLRSKLQALRRIKNDLETVEIRSRLFSFTRRWWSDVAASLLVILLFFVANGCVIVEAHSDQVSHIVGSHFVVDASTMSFHSFGTD